MTYGEAYTAQKRSMKLVKGRWKTIVLPKHSPKMERIEAIDYYSKKLNNIWHELLSKVYPAQNQRESIIKNVSTNSLTYRLYCINLGER